MARTLGPEAQLYPSVERWAAKTLGAWATAVDTGPSVGRIDVVAVRDFGGGDLASRSEVVAIEVKRSGQPFVKSVGQAHGYSVMADRCYLARLGAAFTDQEQVVASRLGVGLLGITAAGRVIEVATAPLQEPLAELRLKLLEKMGCGLCAICTTVFRVSAKPGDYKNVSRATNVPGGLLRAADRDEGLVWWLYSAAGERDLKGRSLTYWRRYACPDCVRALAPKD